MSAGDIKALQENADGTFDEIILVISSISVVNESPVITLPTQTAILDTTAIVGATLDCKGLSTIWSIEYGSTTAYGSTQAGGTTSTNGAKTVQLTGLTPNSTIHWRFKAVNSGGTTYSSDQTLSTLANYAKIFNGSSSSISFAYLSDYAIGTSDFVIKTKFKGLAANNSSLRTIISSNSTADNKRAWFLGTNAGNLIFYLSDTGTAFQTNTTSVNVLDNAWHEVVVMKIKQQFSLILDGVIQAVSVTGTIPASILSNSKPITIGSTSNSPVTLVFNGRITDSEVKKQGGAIDLFIFGGQSNMTGYDNAASELTAELQRNQPNFLTYDSEAGTGTRIMLSPKLSYWGSEVKFGYEAFKAGKNVAIVKVSEGGTGFGEGQWIKGGSLYNRLIAAYNATKSELETSGYTVNTKALVWMQGENDTRSTTWANAYATNFTQFIADLKSDLSLLSLPVIMGKIHDNLPTGGDGGRYDYSGIVRDQQELLATQGKVTLINTDDLTLKSDSVHYNTAGLVELGARFYAAASQYMTSVTFRSILKTLMTGTTSPDISVNANNGTEVNITSEIL